jgi:hypothetical protein
MIEVRGTCRVPFALITKTGRTGQGQLYRKTTVAALPDYALLEIFHFYVDQDPRPDVWHALVHVCRRWRFLVFASPRRLKLRLLCTNRRPVRTMLDIWPDALPIFILWETHRLLRQASNVFAALEHRERVCRIDLWRVEDILWERCAAAMREPFPELTELALRLDYEPGDETGRTRALPEPFLGGTCPRLRSLDLHSVPFPSPALSKLLSSANDLVTLRLWDIPDSGYISPETMLACLFAMTRLRTLQLGFSFSQSHLVGSTGQRQPSLAREVLPSLTQLQFRGVSEYLGALVSRIDVPLLDNLAITFFHQPTFDTAQLLRLIDRVGKFRELNEAVMVFSHHTVDITLLSDRPQAEIDQCQVDRSPRLALEILCRDPDLQLSYMAKICASTLPPISTLLERLEIIYHRRLQFPHGNAESAEWLALLQPFTAVKDLFLSKELVFHTLFALQDLAVERAAAAALPALQNLHLKGSLHSSPARLAVEFFVAAREQFGRPVTVDIRETDLSDVSAMADVV